MSLYSAFSGYYEEAFPLREEVIGFLQNHFPKKGNSILDLGCGPGHYCGRFQQEGFCATGIDLDEKMIDAARCRYPDARFECMDLNRLETLSEKFDTIYSIGNVIAHIPHNEHRNLLTSIRNRLNPGATGFFRLSTGTTC